jgi:hypothetical protein
MPYPAIIRRLIAPAAALAALLLTIVTAGAASASVQSSPAQTSLPVNYDFAAGAATTFNLAYDSPAGRQQFLLPAQRRPSESGGPGARDPGQYER